MQRRWVRRLSPRVLVVALSSVAIVVTAVAVSQADPRGRAVSVAMLSGGSAASLPGADTALPTSPETGTEAASPAPESPPAPNPSTTWTSPAAGPAARLGAADAKVRATTATAKHCPTTGSPDRACGPPCGRPAPANTASKCPPPCPQPGSANSATACPPPCAKPATPPDRVQPAALNSAVAEPARPACPPPTCRQYDPRTGNSWPCPPPCSDAPNGSGTSCPPPPCSDAPNGSRTSCPSPPPPCERDASCPPPCYETQPAPAMTTTDPVPPSQTCPPPCQGPKACPPPCPSAAPTDQSCTPPCSYQPTPSGSAAGAFAPCPAPSGVEGRVTAGPTCPVERSDQPCPDQPVETTLRLMRNDGSVAATGKSAPDGTFRIVATPGSYRLVADWPSGVGGCGPVNVTVEQGRFARADVTCDTGIR